MFSLVFRVVATIESVSVLWDAYPVFSAAIPVRVTQVKIPNPAARDLTENSCNRVHVAYWEFANLRERGFRRFPSCPEPPGIVSLRFLNRGDG